MSEIKGQLLGIVLTIAVFGIVFAAMTVTFQKVSQSVEEKATSAVGATVSTSASVLPAKPQSYTLKY